MSTKFETVVSSVELDAIVERLAGEIAHDHPAGVTLIAVLTASVFFAADLVRHLSVPCVVDFLALSRYAGGQERIRILKDLELDVSGAEVVIVEEIVDTGLSLGYVSQLLTARGARAVSTCALLDRPTRRILPVQPRYVGREVGDAYLVGYGLDYRQRYRNLAEIVAVDPASLESGGADFERSVYNLS